MSRRAAVQAAYRAVLEEVRAVAAEQSAAEPTLVAVSKYMPAEDVQAVYDAGHRDFGENYTQELAGKAAALPKDIRWHFIGALQSNKTKIVGEIPNLAVVETVDSAAKATRLNKHRGALDPLAVFIQVNTSQEAQKAGLADADEIFAVAQHILGECPALSLRGLMTIGSLGQSRGAGENADFRRLVELRDALEPRLGLAAGSLGLSMGMSADYAEAIRQGATNVRVGSNIFGARQTKDEHKAAQAGGASGSEGATN